MRKSVLIVLAVVAAALTVGVGAALAAPHFASASGEVNSAGALVVTFDERGLGNENIDYLLTADATEQQFEGQVSAGASIEPKNGRVRASIPVGPLQAPQFTCPKGQSRELAHVSYDNILLTDTTNNVSVGIPPASRCLLPNIPGLCP